MSHKTKTNHYANHLADVNKTNKVLVSKDVYNSDGVLLIRAGAEVNKATALKIGQHKIATPIENIIELEKSVTPANLLDLFKQLPSHPEMAKVFENAISTTSFERECKAILQYPTITQKLTVLAKKYPRVFKKSVMAAYLGLLICEELSLDPESTNCVFLASLCQDLGLLHIAPEVVRKKGVMTGEEWKLLQGHVAIGYHFLSMVPKLPKLVSRAVLEHHERTDGFGYPRHQLEAKLCQEGQIVAIVDTTIALFDKYVFGKGYSINALIPIMQINAGINMYNNSQALLRLLKRHFPPLVARHSGSEMVKLVKNLIERIPYVYNWFEVGKEFNTELQQKFENDSTKRTAQMVNRIQFILASSGIGDESIIHWLEEIEPNQLSENDFMEVELLALMFSESCWQLSGLLKQFTQVVNELEAKGQVITTMQEKVDFLVELFLNIKSPII